MTTCIAVARPRLDAQPTLLSPSVYEGSHLRVCKLQPRTGRAQPLSHGSARPGASRQTARVAADREPQPTLTGPRVRLRPWRPDDADAVHAACQDAELQRWTEVPVPYLREHAEQFVGPIAARTWAEGGALFAVEHDGVLVGSMGVHGVRDGVAPVGYWTVAGQRGRGLTGEALRVLTGWALAQPDVHRVELVADPANTASCRVAESAGLRAEGVLRQRYAHRGVPTDVVLYAVLATDPRPPVRPTRDAR
jgi:RimJ/RimL family protein N-acetyltransferase